MKHNDNLPILPLTWEHRDEGDYVAKTWIGDIVVSNFDPFGWSSRTPEFGGAWSTRVDDDSFASADEAMAAAEEDLRAYLAPFLVAAAEEVAL